MTANRRTLTDGFNTLCGAKLGSGSYRNVFAMRFDPSKVVKIEYSPAQRWCNVLEFTIWQNWKHCTAVAKWLAPCHHLSEGGHVLIMDRTTAPIHDKRGLPKSLPEFLTDVKPENFGYIGKRLVCHDYAFTVSTMSAKRRRVNWRIEDAYC